MEGFSGSRAFKFSGGDGSASLESYRVFFFPMTVASLVYLKYREYQGVPSEEDPEEE